MTGLPAAPAAGTTATGLPARRLAAVDRTGRRASRRPLRICVIASSRFPVAEPFAGGLEAHTHALVRVLRRRGHEVTLFAAPGSDPALEAELLDVPSVEVSETARRDVAAPPAWWMREHHAYLGLMLHLQHRTDLDVVHNNSLHHLPVAMAGSLPAPMVTTLHTPPLPWLESAVALSGGAGRFVAVSDAMRRAWAHAVDADVVHNGVDPAEWTAGPGGERAVWSGRLVPEKAPHLAVRAALLAGMAIDLVGPVGDTAYVDTHVRPLLAASHGRARHLGHLPQHALRERVQQARVAVVSPTWEEPFGLVAAEALATGTPVAAFARGALPEIVTAENGRLAAPDDVAGLAAAMREAATLDRSRVRACALARFAHGPMVDSYERVYHSLTSRSAA